jgi:hypothetical protein
MTLHAEYNSSEKASSRGSIESMPEPLTFDDLLRFHREIAVPDIERMFTGTNGRIDAVQGQMLTLFDGVYVRLDRLESEVQALRAASVLDFSAPSAPLR